MKTEVVFSKSKDGKERLIAYTNAKKQRIFLPIIRADIAPQLGEVLVLDNTNHIDNVIQTCFEYEIYKKEYLDIGVREKHIWKPLLTGDFGKELDFDVYELCRAKRDLAVLIQKLQEILLYVEPSKICLQTYSHKLRELLILSCTEFECSMKNYNFGNNERTSDYIKILDLVDLRKYKVDLAGYSETFTSRPFSTWRKDNPTKSLHWYDAYTQTKHDRTKAFNLATLENCLNAISANLILFCVRYSPQCLYNENDLCSNLVRNTFAIQIEDSSDIYIPIFEGQRNYSGAFGRSISFRNGTSINNVFDGLKSLPFVEK